jgi:hypothetical protein
LELGEDLPQRTGIPKLAPFSKYYSPPKLL